MKHIDISILDGELLSALGTPEARLRMLKGGQSLLSKKQIAFSGQQMTFPYYTIDDESRETLAEAVLPYIYRAVEAVLQRYPLNVALRERTALFIGASSIDFSVARELECSIDPAYAETVPCRRVGSGYYADAVQKHFGFGGSVLTYNTACTSSANALMDAATSLKSGRCDFAMVIGLEMFSETTLEGFASMQLLSSSQLSPFDRNRDGIILGEAVSAVLLGRTDIEAGAWRLLGGMSNCETYSVTGANPDGKAIAAVMQSAMRYAGVSAGEITAVKAHGTASALNDTAELNAMRTVFDAVPPYLSLKPYIGHTLGGCGTAELLLLMQCINDGFLPASLNCAAPEDPETAPIGEAVPMASGTFLMNYFGFGGNNTSFVIRKEAP